MGTAVTHQAFREKLRSELDRKQWGVRTLARALAEKRGTAVEVERRRINKYLTNGSGGVTPTPEMRALVEDALDVPRGALEPDADDEESALRAVQIERGLSMLDDLYAALHAAKATAAEAPSEPLAAIFAREEVGRGG